MHWKGYKNRNDLNLTSLEGGGKKTQQIKPKDSKRRIIEIKEIKSICARDKNVYGQILPL